MKALSYVISIAALVGCASPVTVDSWRGRRLDDLQFAWGPPARATTLADGRSMVSYEHLHSVQGNGYQCTVTFFADTRGTIVNTSTEGNIGGCNALLRAKRPAS